jgi:hypothetical protein
MCGRKVIKNNIRQELILAIVTANLQQSPLPVNALSPTIQPRRLENQENVGGQQLRKINETFVL